MIGFWVAAAALTAIAVLLLLRPLTRPTAVSADAADYARKVYADQVAEIDRDLARGVITPDQAKAARAEVGRRLLATTGRSGHTPAGEVRPSPKLAMALTLLVPLAALGLYLPLGSPNQPAQPFAQREQAPAVPPNVLQAMHSLERKLEENPDDLAGWTLLAATYAAMERYGDSAEAYRRAVGLSQGDPELVASYAEQMVLAADGIVGEEARRAFESVVEKLPGDPRARYYLGVARQQAGDLKGAIERWAALLADSPADAPWVGHLRSRIHDAAVQIGLDPVALTPQPLPPTAQADAGPAQGGGGPMLTPEQMQQMAELPPEERDAFIRSMVDGLAQRLEEDPGDVDGWLRLARARSVLGDAEGALAALRRATEAAPDRADVWLAYARAVAPATEDAVPDPAFLEALRKVLALDGANPQALYYLGEDAARNGRPAEARDLWQRLLAVIPPGTPDHEALKDRIEGLPTG